MFNKANFERGNRSNSASVLNLLNNITTFTFNAMAMNEYGELNK